MRWVLMTDLNKRPSAEIINLGLGDIEKVRNILFGKYVASFEQRITDLESRLESDLDQLKDRLTEKTSNMNEMVNKSLEELDQRIVSEQKGRDTELRTLEDMLEEAETGRQQHGSLALCLDDVSGSQLQLTCKPNFLEVQAEIESTIFG